MATATRPMGLFERHGLGSGPYQVFLSIPIPDPDRSELDPDAHRKAMDFARNVARVAHVDLTPCRCCGELPGRLYVLQAGDGQRSLVCRECVADGGYRTLLRKLAWMGHEQGRMRDRLTDAKGRLR